MAEIYNMETFLVESIRSEPRPSDDEYIFNKIRNLYPSAEMNESGKIQFSSSEERQKILANLKKIYTLANSKFKLNKYEPSQNISLLLADTQTGEDNIHRSFKLNIRKRK